ncbi:MAG: PHP domain-containing protein [Clostridia bacterium]|nr:PHP domain-containing protein [Clostridia bacterium]
MRKYLLPETGTYYKANLHCHTTMSDGRLTPEEIKRAYMDKGYSIVAYTDHEFIFTHHDLAEENFLPITAYEAAFNEPANGRDFNFIQTYHLNLYAKDKNNTRMVMPNESTLRAWNKRAGRDENYLLDTFSEFFPAEYSQDYINRFVAEANRAGFLVCLNHPGWSMQTYHDYDRLNGLENEGLFAMELSNYSCVVAGYIEDSNHIYDRMLRGGCRKLYASAADDNHNRHPMDSPRCDSFGGFTMIKAEKLDYDRIMQALEKGDFYASTGPLFEDVYYEDGKVYVKCSPVRSIRLLNEGRDAPVAIAPAGELLTEAVFDVDPAFVGRYVRVDIRDAEGNFADTRAYFLDELI